MAESDIIIPETGADKDENFVDDDFKGTVPAGDAESMQSNPNSLGYGVQKIMLEYWDPENEKYWEVSEPKRSEYY